MDIRAEEAALPLLYKRFGDSSAAARGREDDDMISQGAMALRLLFIRCG